MAADFLLVPSEIKAPTRSDRRVLERLPCNVEISCQLTVNDNAALRCRGCVRDVNERGVGLTLERQAEPGSSLVIEMPSETPGRPCRLLAQVMHCTLQSPGQWFVGCSFTRELSADDLAHIEDSVARTWCEAPKPLAPSTNAGSYLVNIYPPGPMIGKRFELGPKPATLGRGDDNEIRIWDQTVSRRHARVECCTDGFHAIDLTSTNGTFVNDERVTSRRLEDGDYLRVGACIFRFLTGGNIEAAYHEELFQLSVLDGLTGIHNKRYLLDGLQRALAHSSRYRHALALIMFDIDCFKAINDSLGHLAGDYALQQLVVCLKEAVRRDDIFARFGGEEFVIAAAQIERAQALELAERLRQLVESHSFCYDAHSFRLTISVGVAFTTGAPHLAPADFIQQADRKLYQAKRTGRNRVVA